MTDWVMGGTAGSPATASAARSYEVFTTPEDSPIGYVLTLTPVTGARSLTVWADVPKTGGITTGGQLYPLRSDGSRGVPWSTTITVPYCGASFPAGSRAMFPWLTIGPGALDADAPTHSELSSAGQPVVKSRVLNPWGYEFEFTVGLTEAGTAIIFTAVWDS